VSTVSANQQHVDQQVELAAVDFDIQFEVEAEWTFRAVASEPTVIDGQMTVERISWLNSEFWILADSLHPLAPWDGAPPLAPGEVRAFSDSHVASHQGSTFPGHFAWQDTLAGADLFSLFRPLTEPDYSYFSAWSTTGAPLPIELVLGTATGVMTVSMTETYELAETPSAVYCSSPPNSTGATGRLVTYGSPAAQSEMFSVQAVDLPIGTAALLFMATDFASVPSGSTTLCVSGAIRRAGGVQIATDGTAQFDVDLMGYLPGAGVYLQSYYRDPLLGVGATSGSVVLVQ
jgi:hypothetical protein